MTQTTKSIKRETLSQVRSRGGYRPLVIELNTTYVKIKPKGMRTCFVCTYDQIWNIACRAAAEALRAEREAKRKERKNGR